jgi:hypothetical protein
MFQTQETYHSDPVVIDRLYGRALLLLSSTPLEKYRRYRWSAQRNISDERHDSCIASIAFVMQRDFDYTNELLAALVMRANEYRACNAMLRCSSRRQVWRPSNHQKIFREICVMNTAEPVACALLRKRRAPTAQNRIEHRAIR